MKLLERVARFLSSADTQSQSLIDSLFPDAAEAHMKVEELCARANGLKRRQAELERMSWFGREGSDPKLAEAAQALLTGKEQPPSPDLETELRQVRRDLEITQQAVRLASQKYGEIRAQRSLEVTRAVQAQHRAIVREMARLVAQACSLAQQEKALRERLASGGVELGEVIPALSFAPISHRGSHRWDGPLATWFDTLRRFGALGADEEPLDIAPADRPFLSVAARRELTWADLASGRGRSSRADRPKPAESASRIWFPGRDSVRPRKERA